MKSILLYLIVGLLSCGALSYGLYERLFAPETTNLVGQWQEVGLEPELLDPYMGLSCLEDESSFVACQLAFDRMSQQVDGETKTKASSLKEQFDDYKKLFSQIQAKKVVAPDFATQWESLKAKFRGKPESSLVVSIGINSLLHLNRDPHTVIVPRSRYEEMVNEKGRSLVGIGISVTKAGEAFRISRVLPRSPAARAGLKIGDLVTSIDGNSVEGLSIIEVRRQLGLDETHSVELEVVSSGETKRLVHLEKTNLEFNNVYSKLISSPSGEPSLYLTIARFSKGICKDVEHQLIAALESNARDVILDLRGNPGGPLREAACVADLFLPGGLKIFEVRYYDDSKASEIYKSQTLPVFTYPVTTIIDAHTASAAELLAGALRDHDRSLLIGERSYGKGSFQRGRVWVPYEKAVLLETQGLYHLPSGPSPQLVGLIPDLPMDLSRGKVEREEDLFLDAKIVNPNRLMKNQGVLAQLAAQCLSEGEEFEQSTHQTENPVSEDPVVVHAGRVSDCLRAKGVLADLSFSGRGE